LAGNILDEVRAKRNTFGRLSHKIIPGNNSLIIDEYIPACFWTIVDKMALEETDFERNPAQKQFRVTRNSQNSKRGAQGLLGEGGPLNIRVAGHVI